MFVLIFVVFIWLTVCCFLLVLPCHQPCVCDEIQREIEGEGETEEVMICMMLKEYSYVTLYKRLVG